MWISSLAKCALLALLAWEQPCHAVRLGEEVKSGPEVNIDPSLIRGRPKLDDPELTMLLALAAKDVYTPGKFVSRSGVLRLVFNSTDNERSYNVTHVTTRKDIQYAFYEILTDSHKGDIVMSVRGTDPLGSEHDRHRNMDLHGRGPDVKEVTESRVITVNGESKKETTTRGNKMAETVEILLQDLDSYNELVNRVEKKTKSTKVSYITGHSLGGALAQIVALKANVPGAVFNSRAVCNVDPNNDWCQEEAEESYTFPFEVHQTDNDWVINKADEAQKGQEKRFFIAPPQMHHSRNVDKAHSVACLIVGMGCSLPPILCERFEETCGKAQEKMGWGARMKKSMISKDFR
eukprot:TRINITY_DN1764_c0_g1_i5.p1 TRINITY_DN1764_c0_g1~~TRINITY_DN1764_c0_g1_i5.p1  ORF type:complete len:382 (-),score=53.99 TRINITY_DN1764_c0_g1_i5:707-1750(-)